MVGNVLTHLIHKKVQPKIRGLLVDVGFDLFCEVLNGDSVVLAVLVEDAHGRSFRVARHLGVGFGNVGRLQQGLLAAHLPGLTGHRLVRRLEVLVQPPAIKLALKPGDVAQLAVVATHFVEDLHKHRQQGIELGLADDVGLLVNVEQDAFRGNLHGPPQLAPQELVFDTFGQKIFQRRFSLNLAVLQQ